MGCTSDMLGPTTSCGGCRIHVEKTIKTTTIEEEYRNISMDIDEIFSDCGAGIQDDSLAVEPELVAKLRRRLKGKVDELSALLRISEKSIHDIYEMHSTIVDGTLHIVPISEIKKQIKTDIMDLVDNVTNRFEEMLIIGFRRYGELPPKN